VVGLSIIETWGSSAEERTSRFPCDGVIGDPDGTVYRAVDVAAPVATVFRWLCQLRVAPYSYDWIDNLGRPSPRALTPGLEMLEVGQRFMTIFRLVSFEEGSSITFDSTTAVFGRVAGTYRVTAAGPDRSRLLVKLMFSGPPGPYGLLIRHLLPICDLIMMRKQLLNLKALAERDR
jgi:hypothetical protein